MKNILITYLAILLSSGLFIYADKNNNSEKGNIRKITTSSEISIPTNADSQELENIQPIIEEAVISKKTTISYNSSNAVVNPITNEAQFEREEPEVYIIGIDENTHYDSPSDNIIHFNIAENIDENSKVFLEYDLYGLADYNSVCMSINDYLSQGGMVICANNEWTPQVQEIAPYQVEKGENSIVLNLPESFQGQYKIRNFNFRIEESKKVDKLVIRQDELKSFYGEYAYVSGFVNNYSDDIKIFANDIEFDCYKGTFEGIVPAFDKNGNMIVLVEVFSGDNVLETKEIVLENNVSYSFIQPSNRKINHTEMIANPNMNFNLELPGIYLNAPAGFVENSLSISVIGLQNIDMPLPDVAMINVTGENDGFRCLPHGEIFNKDIEIAIKYDTLAIPNGYGPEDIRTFYFDDSSEKWVMLELDTIDIENNLIISKTNHFTDFINAILKTPELPTNEAFTPTSLKDLDYAHPLNGINIMSPPSANNSGSANLSFPIQIPAGRRGVQPHLAVTYSSDGGSGMCGVGWDINIPSITVDTRWGVPRYNEELETEEYLVNGEQIVEIQYNGDIPERLPLAHMEEYRYRSSETEVEFAYRVEGKFDKIIRHGNSPNTYWWEVIDKNGTRYIYGKYGLETEPSPLAVLSQPETGNIGKWMITEVIDTYGNKMHYKYIGSEYAGVPGTGGKQIYLTQIFYTDYGTNIGEYSIDFDYAEKEDINISGRYGFLEVTNKLYRTIEINYSGQFIRAYLFNYEHGAYQKTILKSIADVTDQTLIDEVTENIDCDNITQYSGATVHCFDYYMDESIEFEQDPVKIMETEEEEVSLFEAALTDQTRQSLGRYKGQSFAFGGAVCVGLGLDVSSKMNTVGVNYTHSRGNNSEIVQILDLNGDGLADKVVEKKIDNQYVIFFYKGIIDEGDNFIFENTSSGELNIPGLSMSWNRANSFGGEILAGISGGAVSVGATYTRTKTKTISSRYFADINSDGFIDFVDNGYVRLNFPDENGIPNYTTATGGIQEYECDDCYSFNNSGSVIQEELDQDDEPEPSRRDPVRMWICPKGSKTKITGSIQRVNSNVNNNDIIYYSIEKYRPDQGTSEFLISPTDDPIQKGDFYVRDINLEPVVTEGDILFFRLHSDNDLGFDDIVWNININPAGEYMESNLEELTDLNPDGDPIYNYNYADDAVIYDAKAFEVPYSGIINLESELSGPELSDKLTYQIFHLETGSLTLSPPIYTQGIYDNTPFIYEYDENNIEVAKGDILFFILNSKTNVNWSDIDFDATIEYVETDLFGTEFIDQFVYKPSIIMSIYPNIIEFPKAINLEPGAYFVTPAIVEDIDDDPSIDGEEYIITFSAKANHKLLDKTEIKIIDGEFEYSISNYVLQFEISNPGENVSFEYFINGDELDAQNISNFIASVQLGSVTENYRCGSYSKYSETKTQFGNLYRGWGQFSYFDDNNDFYLIDPDLLDNTANEIEESYLDQDYYDDLDFSSLNDESTYEEAELAFLDEGIDYTTPHSFETMKADRKNNRWIDNSNCAYTGASQIGSGAGAQDASQELTNSTFTNNSGGEPNFDTYVSGSFGAAINKMSYQFNNSFTVGGGFEDVNLGLTYTFSRTEGMADLIDMNGDSYPDVVATTMIQYSNPQGGISQDVLDYEENFTTFAKGRANGGSMGVKGTLMKSANPNATILDNIGGSFGIGNNKSNSKTREILIDVNGDGLPDRFLVDIESGISTIRYNLGYDFTESQIYSLIDLITETESKSTNYNFGGTLLNRDQFSFAIGIGASTTTSLDIRTIMDINSDGLVDIVYAELNPDYPYPFVENELKALINTGSSFIPVTLQNNYNSVLAQNSSVNASANGAFTTGISFNAGLQWKIVFSAYADINYSVSAEKLKVADINGDGATDFVFESQNTIKAKFGIPNKTNILKKVTTPGLSNYTIDYIMSYPDVDNPKSKWVMGSLVVNDGYESIADGAQRSFYKFTYDNGKYHRLERESFGFQKVTTYQVENFESNTIYRSTEEDYHTDDFMFKGLKNREMTYGSNGEPYVQKKYTWVKKHISSGDLVSQDEMTCFGAYFPAIQIENIFYYEGEANPTIMTEKVFTHGQYGIIKEYTNRNSGGTDDDIKAIITYNFDTDLHLLNMVDELTVYNDADILVRKSKGYYNEYGDIAQMVRYEGSNLAKTNLFYDNYGNVTRIEYPYDINGDKLSYDYTYDEQIFTYPKTITDFWGNTMNTTYDYKFGLPLAVTDHTGNQMIYSYLSDGRIRSITGPNEVLNGAPYTIKYEYWDYISGGDNLWAMTKHYDPLVPGNEFITVNISDGLGRVVQSKKTSVVNGDNKVVVSGKILYDDYGRKASAYQPSVEDYDLQQITHYSNNSSVNPTTFDYDVLDRPVKIVAPDNTIVLYNYDFGSDVFGTTCFRTDIVDPNEKITKIFKDSRGLQTTIIAPLNTITSFEYSPLGELLITRDPEYNSTVYEYNMLGRLTRRVHPDANTTAYTYDLAGNVLTVETENLNSVGEVLQYVYEECRLSEISYPLNPEMNVYYKYGESGSGNQSGRLVKQQDASGVQVFIYGNMGEIIENAHTYVVPAGDAYTFSTKWEYDSWNRLKRMMYPDGEEVKYMYDNGGQLYAMNGSKSGEMFEYISKTKYDKYGRRTAIKYGNGTITEYIYDDVNLRLKNLRSKESTGSLMQDLHYTYDNIGNIIQLDNLGEFVNINFGGNSHYIFKYDNLNRLYESSGNFASFGNGNMDYSLMMDYSPSGNINEKRLVAHNLINGGTNTISYNRKYEYNDRPHNPTNISATGYQWDLNGNMTNRILKNAERSMCWDEENRLVSVHDWGQLYYLSSYLYDAGGERVWKFSGPEMLLQLNAKNVHSSAILQKTLYASPFMVMTETNYTKHYYIEGERICSKIGGGFGAAEHSPTEQPLIFIIGNENSVAQDLRKLVKRNIECSGFAGKFRIDDELAPAYDLTDDPENMRYFYHPDHLGSSSFITNIYGKTEQHLQYLPYGEIFVSQRSKSFDSRYKFTAKELDNETNYTYFGARYYDSDASIFISVDPMSDARPNLSPYNYCQLNPVGRVDPNGALDTDILDWYKSKSGKLLWSSESTSSIDFDGECFDNIASGDCLPIEYQSNTGANLLISGHTNHNDANYDDNSSWDHQIGLIANGNSDQDYVFAIASNADDFIHSFEVVTANFGQVNNGAYRGHAYDNGLSLGLTGGADDFNSLSGITSFVSLIMSNNIVMSNNASMYFMGCNTGYLAEDFANATGVTSYGAFGKTGPTNTIGSFHIAKEDRKSGGFYKYNPSEESFGFTKRVKF